MHNFEHLSWSIKCTRRQAGVADADGKMPMEYAAEKCSYGMFSLFVKAMVGDI